MKTDMRSAVFTLAEAHKSARTKDGKRFASLAERGSLRLLCSFPLRPNEQTPHETSCTLWCKDGACCSTTENVNPSPRATPCS